MREKDDLETYIKGLEHTLIQCQVDEEEWLFYPTANMMGKYATLVQGLLVAEVENCVSGYPVVPAGRDVFGGKESPRGFPTCDQTNRQNF